ncbi:MAG: Carboxypeptidase regulatory-like domain [Cereibacter sp.]|jgi:hypothetical protein|nr:Carboxypeptidase regulatory-like domain [Cereibacter sp.]
MTSLARLLGVSVIASIVPGGSALAQSTTVTGLVADGSGKPLSNYPVVLFEKKPGGSNWVGITDEDGKFVVPGVPEGDFVAVPAGNSTQQFPFELNMSKDPDAFTKGQYDLFLDATKQATNIGTLQVQK